MLYYNGIFADSRRLACAVPCGSSLVLLLPVPQVQGIRRINNVTPTLIRQVYAIANTILDRPTLSTLHTGLADRTSASA